MVTQRRSAFALILALTLAVASVGSVHARHLAAGAQTMVICTGYGLVQILIDADGNPVDRTVPCPDCVVVPPAMLPDLSLGFVPVPPAAAAQRPLGNALHKTGSAGHWHSPRAPPSFPV